METEQEKGKEAQAKAIKYVVDRDGERDLVFAGDILAQVSSHSNVGPQQNRWTEIDIYRTRKGKYIVAIRGRTCWQGEINRHEAHVCDDEAAVIRALSQDGTYISDLAKKAMDEAEIEYNENIE